MNTAKTIIALSIVLAASNVHAQAFGNVEISPVGSSQPATASADFSIAIGQAAVAGQLQSDGSPALAISPLWSYANQVSVGTNATAWGHGDTAIGTGAVAISQPTLGTNGASTSVGYGATTWGLNSVAIGSKATTGGATAGTAPMTNPTVSNATAIGSLSNAAANNSTAIGTGSQALATNSVALGAGSVATQANTVEVGGRRITGVADPINGQDAVNLRTLQAAIAGLSIGGGSGIDSADILNQANAYTDNAIRGLRKEYSQAIAAVAASPILPALARGEQAIAVGGGFYNGEQAIGILYGHAISDRALINAGVSAAAGGKAVGKIGAAWKW